MNIYIFIVQYLGEQREDLYPNSSISATVLKDIRKTHFLSITVPSTYRNAYTHCCHLWMAKEVSLEETHN